MQALLRYANERGIRVVSRAEFDRLPGPRTTLAQYDRLAARRTSRRGHAPRPATNGRSRGAKRTTGSGTTSSGEDPDPSERPCANCSRSLPADSAPQRKNCEDADCKRERGRQRVRKHRGTQDVLAEWTDDGRTYSIVDLDLDREHYGRHEGRGSKMHVKAGETEGDIRRRDAEADALLKGRAVRIPRCIPICRYDGEPASMEEVFASLLIAAGTDAKTVSIFMETGIFQSAWARVQARRDAKCEQSTDDELREAA